MRARVNQLLARRHRACRTALFALAAITSITEASADDLDARWLASFALTGGVTWGEQRATVSSNCLATGSSPPTATTCDPAEPSFGSQLRRGDVGEDRATTPYVGANLQLMTPALPVIARPRLFADVELPHHFGIDRNVAQRQRPTGMREPDNPGGTEQLDEEALLGAGSRTRSEIQGLVFGAHAGVSLAFELWNRQFQLKPSVGWIRYKIGVRGRVESAICNNPFDPRRDSCDLDGIPPEGVDAFTRVITLKGHESQWFDGVGPSLELEMDTGHLGPFGVSLFLAGAGYYLHGDRDLAFTVRRTIGPDKLGGPVDYNADFTFRVAPWLYRAGVGMRFTWLGTPD